MNLLNAKPMVIDFETSGLDPETSAAVEVATVILNNGTLEKCATLINPGVPIEPEASAVHHIIAADVVNAPRWPEVRGHVLEQDFDVIVAHNAAFDMTYLAKDGGLPEGKPILCTWRMARKLLPDMPTYSNMALHYRLGLPGRPTESHRAMSDALVTMGLYRHLLGVAAQTSKTPGEIDTKAFVDWVNGPMMEKKIRFGKYRDELWADIARRDPGYLKWVRDKSDIAAKDPDILHTINVLLRGGR